MTRSPALEVRSLSVVFGSGAAARSAVTDVSLSVARGRVLCVVGESGSGKSVTAQAAMGLLAPPAHVVGGSVRLDGVELLGRSEREWRRIRGRDIAMVFQEPMTALNPVLRIGTQMLETLRAHERDTASRLSATSRAAAWQRCRDMLGQVGIADPDSGMRAWPHAFSGGMLQRVSIAMALLLRPKVIIADEPTTALDVTVQRQILELVTQRVQEVGCALLWITHDLAVARALADEVAFMWRGRVVEHGVARAVLSAPRHPYARRMVAVDARLRAPSAGEAGDA